MPPQWAKLEELLTKSSSSSKPPRSFILGYWFECSDTEKLEQVSKQIEWADNNNVYHIAHEFILALTPKQWHCK
ncbi:hypothetical protein DBO93_09775 [Colwellia sp. Arc7-D]|nr:hypothetical protein DBO93_09775 [Colwellia sp. Arc7-D]